jgi:S1-C subfamily serine protease
MNLILLLPTLLPLSACTSPSSAPVSISAPAQEDESLADVYERVHMSVVTIKTVGKQGTVDAAGQVRLESGLGSGVLISDDGKIMTAAHVVQTADEVAVGFVGGVTRKARILGSVPLADVALIQIEGEVPAAAKVAPLGDSGAPRVGSRVFVIGSPQGVTHTLTVGHLSARRVREFSVPGCEKFELLQTDAAINQGNSGGPLFDMQGNVIGIVSHIVSRSGGSEGLGFAIGSNVARALLLERPILWSGIDSVMLSGPAARAFQLPEGRNGALVQRVAEGSLGARLGIRGGEVPATIAGQELLIGGDVILEVMDLPVDGKDFYPKCVELLDGMEPKDTLRVLILRGGEERTLGARLEDISG